MKIDAQFIHDLTPQTSRWFARAVAGVVASDGLIDEEEIDFLKISLKFLKNEHEVNEIIELVKNKKLPELSQLRDVNRPMAFRILLIVTKLAMYDLKFTKSEAEYIKHIAGRLGFNKYFQKHFLMWAKDTVSLDRRLDDLKKLAFKIDAEFS